MQTKKICEVCEKEIGQTSCRKCGKLMGKMCQREEFCKDCKRGVLI